MSTSALYIHIPFCRKACHYCNFHFSTSQQQRPALVAALVSELALQKHYLHAPLATLYFGGGTPSLLPAAELEALLQAVHAHFEVQAGAEITLEANPDDVYPESLSAWRSLGINRLSLGVQSFFDEDLQWMNRAHKASQAEAAIVAAQAAGFENLTIDLIYGTPGLTDQRWVQNLEKAFALGVPHLSCYALTVEEGTALHHMVSNRKRPDVDPDVQSRQFHLLVDMTEAQGFRHYEISNFARPGFESRHNSSYWQGKPYLGIGPSAHSFNGESRQWNIANNALYIQAIQKGELPFEKETLSPEQQHNEFIMIRLRTDQGIPLEELDPRFGPGRRSALLHAAQKYLNRNLLKLEEDRLTLTREGRFFADGIAADLFV